MMTAGNDRKITLAPLLFNWPPDRMVAFYERAAENGDVSTVVLGETVCTRRGSKPWDEIRQGLQKAGKKTVFASPLLVTDPKDFSPPEGMDEYEASDMSAFFILEQRGVKTRIGPSVTVYHEGTVAYFADKGVTSVCLPAEIPKESIETLAKTSRVPLEVQVFSPLSLGVSRRCFLLRHLGKNTAACGSECSDYPDGAAVRTMEGKELFAVNGPQVLSSGIFCLFQEAEDLFGMGIRNFRFSETSRYDVFKAIRLFKEGGTLEGVETVNGYYYGTAGKLKKV